VFPWLQLCNSTEGSSGTRGWGGIEISSFVRPLARGLRWNEWQTRKHGMTMVLPTLQAPAAGPMMKREWRCTWDAAQLGPMVAKASLQIRADRIHWLRRNGRPVVQPFFVVWPVDDVRPPQGRRHPTPLCRECGPTPPNTFVVAFLPAPLFHLFSSPSFVISSIFVA